MSIAAATTTRHIIIDSPIGPLTLVRADDGVTGLYYPGHWTNPDRSAFGPQVDIDDDQTSTWPSPSCANTSLVRDRFSICRSTHGAATGTAGLATTRRNPVRPDHQLR